MSSDTSRPILPLDHRVVAVLAAVMFLAPALGVPSELVLQDTLKSALVAFGTLIAALLLFRARLREAAGLAWHPVLGLPLLLLAWALGSMAWSHPYLAGVEAVRWALFALLVWLGLNTLTLPRLPLLATGIHWGAVLASLWVALQFWLDLRWFPQLPPPGSTFLNRNFYAEYVLCTLPFSVLLAAQAQGRAQIALRVFSTAFNVLALLMTGTRSALLAMAVLLPVLVYLLWRYRSQLAWPHWLRADRVLALSIVLGTLIGLGSVPTGNAYLAREGLGQTALERAFVRGQSLTVRTEYTTGSSSTRLQMWQATLRLIADRPLVGAGAGAWEVEIPRYQAMGTQIETDYYAHNEYLQLLAEYGLTGWLFALGLACWLLRAAARTWREAPASRVADPQEWPWRATLLSSLLGLFIVSGAGFPWRLAGAGALFALALGALAASEQRLQGRRSERPTHAGHLRLAQLGLVLALLAGAGLSALAVAAESRLVRAAQLAYGISRSGAPNEPEALAQRAEMLRLVREGVALHPHYRKITPLVADELASWGDWENARWIWASVLTSRPHVVALMTNLARAHVHLGDLDQAQAYYERARALRPDAPSLHSVEVMLLLRRGQEQEALQRLRVHLDSGKVEPDLIDYAYVQGLRQRDFQLALDAQQLRRQLWPATQIDSWLRTGMVYAGPDLRDRPRALAAFQAAWDATPEVLRPQVRELVPPDYRAALR
ncbi:MAG: O-antigen ligase family protein [Hylemonella sp.]|uniref:O-antigen ligase family protein n=1 Tax=Hylemonella sp. TaxID=2066020 RepID=UPI0022BCEC71|nr:O-antigen ligase family protein [Hylemonella sp.]MCZ8251253.1 O-antigen ligase family protein [Hylemonella sp.]